MWKTRRTSACLSLQIVVSDTCLTRVRLRGSAMRARVDSAAVAEPAVIGVEDAEPVSDRPGRTVRVLCEHPLLDVTWSRYEGGQPGPGPHVHHEHVDAFYIVEGELQFRVGPDIETVRAPAGTFVLVPPSVVHGFDD